jgi:leader peptidase (prepilin peptidase)/N-methyltransferase
MDIDVMMPAIAAILGAIVGSFSMGAAWRLPRGLPWIAGRSRCPDCGTPLAARDLVPVLSWVTSAGTASCCGRPISWRYPLWEIFGAAAFAITVLLIGIQPEILPLFMLWGLLAIASLVDLSHRYIPDGAVIGVWLVGLVADTQDLFVPIAEGAMASAGVVIAVLVIRYSVRRFVGREALGLGDVKLFAAAGPWIGIQGMPLLVLASAGLALLGYPVWRRHAGGVEMPFGPAIAVALYTIACFTACST